MTHVQSDPSRYVGLDEIPVSLQRQQPCQRFPIKDRELELKGCPSFACPLNDLPGPSVTLPSFAFFIRMSCPRMYHLVSTCSPPCITRIHFNEQPHVAVLVVQEIC
jgi:hypothetical protein